jgi:hypothetical protein
MFIYLFACVIYSINIDDKFSLMYKDGINLKFSYSHKDQETSTSIPYVSSFLLSVLNKLIL